MPLNKLTALAALSLASLLISSGQASAGVNFVAPGVAGSVTGLTVGGQVYDVAFVGNVTHAAWVSQLDFHTEADAQAAIVALAAELNSSGATTTRYSTPGGGTFDFTTGQLWYDANATTLFGETLIRSGSTWLLANPGPGGSNAPINGAFPFALDFNLVTPSVWTDLGQALAGANGDPVLVGTGTLLAGSSGALTLSNAAGPGALSVLFVSFANTPTPFKGGTLATVPVLVSFTLTTSPAGGFVLPWSAWPPGLSSGTTVYFQFAIQDAAAIAGASLSNAIVGTVP
jgi:hypothetical protein